MRSWARAALLTGAIGAMSTQPGCNALAGTGDLRFFDGNATKLQVGNTDKLDLLFVVGNSLGSGDEQRELIGRLPELIQHLTAPTDATGAGKESPVLDLHIGFITSSLGSQGTDACNPKINPHLDDRAHLMPRPGEVGTSPGCPAAGFSAAPLTWVADESHGGAMFTGYGASVDNLASAASCVLQSIKDDGCGYAAPLEAMYHFLIDPSPYESVSIECSADDKTCTGTFEQTGFDGELLRERLSFLRPDSRVAIVFVSRKNDGSIEPIGNNWIPYELGPGQMAHAFAGCDGVPDDAEPENAADDEALFSTYHCRSCLDDTSDPRCATPWAKFPATLNADIDSLNLRAFHQVQRFGRNFLWPVRRYVDGLTKPVLPTVGGLLGANPLFTTSRTQSMILVAAIVGAPEALVHDATGAPRVLDDAAWAKLVSTTGGERDPHMVESIGPRPGVPKFDGDRDHEKVNGGDRDVPGGDELQFACIGPRLTTELTADCTSPDSLMNPLCGPGKQQPFFGAFPGLRFVRLVHEIGESGLVASACAASYAPIFDRIASKVETLTSCLDRKLVADARTKKVDCQLVEVFDQVTVDGKTLCEQIGHGYCTPGAEPCRVSTSGYAPTSPAEAAAQLTLSLRDQGVIVAASESALRALDEFGNPAHLVCEIQQLDIDHVTPGDVDGCVNKPDFTLPGGEGGWCYTENAAVVGTQCAVPRRLRFVGDVHPRPRSRFYMVCPR